MGNRHNLPPANRRAPLLEQLAERKRQRSTEQQEIYRLRSMVRARDKSIRYLKEVNEDLRNRIKAEVAEAAELRKLLNRRSK